MHDAGKEGVQRTVRAYTTCSTRDRKRHDVARTVRLKNSTHGWPNEQPSRDVWGSVQAAGNRSAASQPEEGSDARTEVRRARYRGLKPHVSKTRSGMEYRYSMFGAVYTSLRVTLYTSTR